MEEEDLIARFCEKLGVDKSVLDRLYDDWEASKADTPPIGVEVIEYVMAYPQPTDEDLVANHAAGLPVKRERLTRCKDCRWAHEAPSVEQWHLECRVRPLSRHYTDANGFCHLGEAR